MPRPSDIAGFDQAYLLKTHDLADDVNPFYITNARVQDVKGKPTVVFTIDNGGTYFGEDGEQIPAAFMMSETPIRRRYVEYFQNGGIEPIGPCRLTTLKSKNGLSDTWVISDADPVEARARELANSAEIPF